MTSFRDLGTGVDTANGDGAASLPWSSGDMMVTLRLEAGTF